MSATAAIDRRTEVSARAGTGRLGALAGGAFALLFFVGVAMLDIPRGGSDARVVEWWSDSGNQTTAIVSMYAFVLAGLCFLVFLSQLRSHLLAAEGGGGVLTTVVVASGVVFVAMLFVAAASRGLIAYAVKAPSSDEVLPGADTLRYMPHTGFAALGSGGMLAAAVTMATTSWLILRTAVFGRWLAWVGAVAAIAVAGASAMLSGPVAIPAMLVWALATSVAIWRGARS